MGIGNGSRVPRLILVLEAHYPSWGSGTRCDQRMGAAGDCSLPLMGIGNGIPGGPVDGRRECNSLPLMGIGNVEMRSGGPRPIRRRQLITPHGDRELENGMAWFRGHGQLITPHGDREPCPVLRRIHERIEYCSLPLMGIGNLDRDNAVVIMPSQAISLPLMGIGNRRTLGRGPSASYELITPHGDRELSIGAASTVSKLAPCLITPHGDREPPAWSYCSLVMSSLITPHGDRERRALSTSSLLMGAGTNIRAPITSSLPLMGIGNGEPALRDREPYRG